MRNKQIHNYSESNTTFSEINRISRQKTSKDKEELDNLQPTRSGHL